MLQKVVVTVKNLVKILLDGLILMVMIAHGMKSMTNQVVHIMEIVHLKKASVLLRFVVSILFFKQYISFKWIEN